MKYILTLLILLQTGSTFAQPAFPGFLQGTWKMENKENYEHWDSVNPQHLKGFSYKIHKGKMIVSEYLDLSQEENEIIYTATVLNQNDRKPISFKLNPAGSNYSFENPNHDFPKKVVYRKLNDSELWVTVSDGNQKEFSYKMIKQETHTSEKDSTNTNPNYDADLAIKLGADDYGMKGYILVILKTGNNSTTDKTVINNSFRGHLENINRLVEQGKMIVAGPMGNNDKTYRGIFILSVPTIEDAEKLMQSDPAIKSGLLGFELYKWYGSAALPEYLKYSDKVWKKNP